MTKYYLIYVLSVFISSVSQIFLKKSTQKEYPTVIQEYLNVQVIGAYIVFFCSSLMTIYAYKGVELSLGPIIESLSYVFVAILSYFFLSERLSVKKMIGMLFILIGIVVSCL